MNCWRIVIKQSCGAAKRAGNGVGSGGVISWFLWPYLINQICQLDSTGSFLYFIWDSRLLGTSEIVSILLSVNQTQATSFYCALQMLHCFLYKLKVCSILHRASLLAPFFPTALARFVSLCLILVILVICQTVITIILALVICHQ